VIQCEQFKTARILLDRLRALPNVEVLFDHEVLGVEQDADSVTAVVRGPDGTARHAGAYLIGADGGRSAVRKSVGIAFDGFTWPERFIVLTTPFDFATRGYCPRSYFADPVAWCNCFKVSADGPPGLWRTVFPTDPAATDEELTGEAGVQVRLAQFFPGEKRFDVVHVNLYVTHQRVAAAFRAGRVLLAGDAAHVNNPIGGMGLNGGIQDACNLTDKLARVLDGADARELDLYDLQRRTVALEFVQSQSIANKRLLEERDPAVRAKNLDQLRATAEDPKRAREYLLRSSMIAMQRRADSIALP
jgi:3-(3-hydroxy-phenyl)propionate hydroxylase